MKVSDALKVVWRQAPCPHDNADTRLGNRKVWAKCEDCGRTFQQDQWGSARKAAEEFEAAMEALTKLKDKS